jgi:cAMP and cAMP-inhibited cGMP 3',5'-cyclic phosphodiesterase 10
MLHLQQNPCVHDIVNCLHNTQVTIPSGFDQFSWYINTEDHFKMPQLCLYMMLQIMKPTELDLERGMQYILSVKKFYRRNPYHNFEHAFNVCHCMHLMLKRNPRVFTHIEAKGLIVAALCHDLDHGGFTNNFLELTKDDLSYLYESSILENHHYYVAALLLEKCRVFIGFTPEDYDTLRKEIKDAIIATDLLIYFKNKSKLEHICSKKEFDWNDQVHRTYLKGIMMTTSDLSGMCKPFLVSKRITDSLYGEVCPLV